MQGRRPLHGWKGDAKMKVRELMSGPAIRIAPGEPVTVAARTLEYYNVGVLPVCGYDGQLRGVVTDRDLVIRCLAAGRQPGQTQVGEIMTTRVVAVRPDTEVSAAARLMAREQIRRLPVVENGKLCGMVSLGDLAGREESAPDAVDALTDIVGNISHR